MARFNNVKTPKYSNTISYEGGYVYEKDLLGEWMNMLFSDFMEGSFYERAADRRTRFIELTNQIIDKYGADFAAKAAIFARNELGMRSISQLVAAQLNSSQFDRKRDFFKNYPHRADDVAEVFAAIDYLGNKRSHALVRGFGDYLSNLDSYSIGKYKMNSRNYNMYDCINITHATSKAINDYKAGWLESPDTWEVKISTAANKEERNTEWKRLVEEHKLGYIALIRNLNNILSSDITEGWIVEYLVPQLIDTKSIFKSLVFPYQIYCAYKNLEVKNFKVITALSDAFFTSVSNMPKLEGSTCIILDVSGSMDSRISSRSNMTIKEVGAVYAAAIMAQNPDADFVKFGTEARMLGNKPNWLNNVFEIIEKLQANDGCGYGTQLDTAMNKLHQHYDRIFLISDMQIMAEKDWWSNTNNEDLYKAYCREYGRCQLYSFDLGNYHTRVGNPANPDVHFCTALNDKVFKFISLLEDKESLFDYINQIEY